jgi:hypothetical protein
MSKRTVPVLAIAVAAFAAGCGSSSDSTSSSTTAALTKAEFIQQADAICTKGNKADDAAQKKAFGSGKPTQKEFEQFVTGALIPSVQGQISGVEALTPPAGDEATVKKMLDDSQAALDKLKSDPTLVLQQSSDPFAKSNQELKAYGLKVCGQG